MTYQSTSCICSVHNGMASSILQQEQLLIQKYESVGRQRILIVNHEDDVNFALKLVIEEEGQILDKRNRFQVDSFNDLILAYSWRSS